MTDALIKARNLVSGFMLPERITDPALADDLALAIADLLTAPQALAATPAVIDRKMIETVIGEFAIDNRELSYLEMEPEEFSRRIMEKIKAKPTATPAVAGEIMRDKLAELQNAGVKSLTINQIVGLLGFSETEAAQPASPLRGREDIAAVLYMKRFPHRTWLSASLAETDLSYQQADAVLAMISASPPDLSSRSAAKAEQPETRQQKNEREMAEGSRCDGSCNDGTPCHCQPAADPATEQVAAAMMRCSLATGHGDTLESLLSEMEWQVKRLQNRVASLTAQPAAGPGTRLTFCERCGGNRLHYRSEIIDGIQTFECPVCSPKEPELPAARPMGQS